MYKHTTIVGREQQFIIKEAFLRICASKDLNKTQKYKEKISLTKYKEEA